MVERKKIAGEAGRLARERGGLGPFPPPQSLVPVPVHFSSRLYFSSFPLSESLEQAKPGPDIVAQS